LKTYKEKEMVDFRRMIPVLAVIAFLLGSAVTASAQTPAPFTCVTNGAVNTPMRAEGLTEQTGDFQITCTGGTPTAPGQQIPQVNIQVFLNTSITSRLMGGSTTLPQLSEALLLLDEPAPGLQYGCATSTCLAYGNGLGTANAPSLVAYYGSGTPGSAVAGCTLATCPGNNKNVYQGLQTASNSVTWLGIPIDPPGTSGARIIRLTNLRGNANALGVSGTNVTPVSVFATVTATPFNFLPVSGLATQSVGSVQRGLQFGVFSSTSSTSAFTPTTAQQCVSRDANAGTVAVLRYSELFATSFKRRNIATSSAAPLASAEQNSLAGFSAGTYNTETGFTAAAITLQANGSGFQAIGQADFGTRLKAVFNNIPNGVNLFVDRTAGSNCTGTTNPPVGCADFAQLTASENGGFAAVSATAGSPPAAGGASAQLTVTNGTATAVWEVLDSQSTSFAVLNFRVWATYTASPATNSPALGVATVNGSYAPTSTLTTAQTASVPIPRFADTSTASNIFTTIPCVTNLLFPYVTSQFGFDTGLAISATSLDPFGTSGQSGTCTLNWYGAAFTGATPTPVVNAGTTYTTLVSGTLNNVTGGFTGYMIAVCRFQYAHGFAFVSDLGARNLAMGYLALIIPDPPRGANPFPGAGNGSGEQLGY
jgi:hypothetical protein